MPGSIFQLLAHSLNTLSSVARDLVHLVVLTCHPFRVPRTKCHDW
jgi:hypothetical protein